MILALVLTPLIDESQCTFWCLVLSDVVSGPLFTLKDAVSQCTFWCLVLSDRRRIS